MTRRTGRARGVWDRIRAPLAVGLATLALVVQLLAPAYHQMAAPAGIGGVAADLKAAFGEVAVLCIQADEAGGPAKPSDSTKHCDDCCPLCRASAGALALLISTPLGEPTPLEARSETLEPSADSVRLKPNRTAFAQPRAPPFEA